MPQFDILPSDAVAALEEMGVPNHIVEYLRTTRGMSKWGYGCSVALLIFLMCGISALPILATIWLPWARWLIEAGIYPRDVILIDLQLFSFVGFLFAGIMLTMVPFSAIMLLNRGLAVRSAISGIQQSIKAPQNRWAVRMMLRRIFQRMPADLPVEDYLVAYHGASARFSCLLALLIILLTLPFVCWEALAASYATPRGIQPGGMFSWNQPFVKWDQIQKLSTGSYGSGPKESAMPVYQLHYSGSSRDLAQWRVPTGGDNLPVLARIDSELRERNVPWSVAVYEYGIYTGQQRWDPVAFDRIRGRLNQDERQMFDQVYRIQP